MTTKTMDSESYLANLESADEQNYKHLFGDEYIKKSDVLRIISTKNTNENAIEKEIGSLPTINPIQEIDNMIEEYTGTQTMTDPLIVCALQELKQRLLK